MDDYTLAEKYKFQRMEKQLQAKKRQCNARISDNAVVYHVENNNIDKTIRIILISIIVIMIVVALIFMLINSSLFSGFSDINKDFKINAVSTDDLINDLMNDNDRWAYKNNADVFECLDNEIWSGLSDKEKFETMEKIKNIELHELGVPNDIKFSTEELDDTTLGQYRDNEKVIVIDESHLYNDSAEEILKIVLHESRHAYQFACIDVYEKEDKKSKDLSLFDFAESSLINSKNYIEYDEDKDNYDEYKSQFIESDAFLYSEYRSHEYYDEIIPEYTK